MSMREYVGHYLHDNPELLDLLSASTSSDSADNHQDSTKYVPHLNATDISIGIKSKRYHRGVIRCKDSWMNGYVIVHTNDGEPRKSINVIGEASINRAVDGDVVAVEVISQAEANSIKSIFKKSTTVTDDVNP
jgi:exosome complex exonuclease DIS3/RRP44